MSKYFTLFWIGVKESLYYREKIAVRIFLWFVRVGLLIILYSYAYKATGHEITSLSLSAATWSIAVYFFLMALMVRVISKKITDDVRHGTIETQINKPIHYLVAQCLSRLGSSFPEALAILACGIPFVLFFIGPPDVSFSFSWLVHGLLLAMGGLILSFCLYLLVGLAAFWLEDSDPLFWMIDKSIMILGGSYVPVALFPDTLKAVARFSPFGGINFATHMFNPNFQSEWTTLILSQITWILISFCLLTFVWKRAQKQLFVNGG